MSELEKRGDTSRYDSMTTEELQGILRKHAHNELETEPDTQELFEIMEVLSTRRQKAGFPAFRCDEDAFAEFSEHYMPKEGETARPRGIDFSSRTFRTAAAVLAVVLVLTVGTTLTAKALRFDIWGRFAKWGKEAFQFAENPQDNTVVEPEKENNVELKSLQDALDQHMITEKLIPTWLPEGFVSEDVRVLDSPKVRTISAKFNKGEVELIITIRQSIGVPAKQVEKSEDLFEIYTIGDIDYYIFSNSSNLQAKWSIGDFEGTIAGQISLEDMKKIIDSI